jgi:hypothetical protein
MKHLHLLLFVAVGLELPILAQNYRCPNPPQPPGDCGDLNNPRDRRAVKNGTDSEAKSIKLSHRKHSTVRKLHKFPTPTSFPPSSRELPEKRVWEVEGLLTMWNFSRDWDYHVVLMDRNGRQMIAEIPCPECLPSMDSPLRTGVSRARQEFNNYFCPVAPMDSWQILQDPIRVTIRGVGFFDKVGQSPNSPNGIEIHPILDIAFHSALTDSALREPPPSFASAKPGRR